MKAYETIKEMLCDEVEEIGRKGELNAGDLDTLHKLTDTIKNIDKISMLEEDGEYSHAGEWDANMRGSYGRGSYGNGDSYTYRNNMRYSGRRRDSRGRYSRAGDMVDQLREMMNDATTDREREAIRMAINTLDK